MSFSMPPGRRHPPTPSHSIIKPPAPCIWRFTDGKAGHENQSLALVENLQRLAPFESLDVRISRWREAFHSRLDAPPPSLVLGAGHRTHLAILATSRRFDCPSVVIMKPTIPAAFFDLCLIPEHDLRRPPADNVLPTRGMLNRIPSEIPPKQDRGLILIGGPSRHHRWNGDPLQEAVAHIVTSRSDLQWTLTDSRRTPDGFLDRLSALPLGIHPSSETGPDWLPQQLLAAREVWVTEDSMSMIYEALTARARVGLLAMPRKSRRSRIVRGLDRLVAEGWTRFLDDGAALALPEPPEALHEASRCAREIVERFFPAFA